MINMTQHLPMSEAFRKLYEANERMQKACLAAQAQANEAMYMMEHALNEFYVTTPEWKEHQAAMNKAAQRSYEEARESGE